MCALGDVHAGAALVHVGYLVLLLAGGWWLSVRRLTARLVD